MLDHLTFLTSSRSWFCPSPSSSLSSSSFHRLKSTLSQCCFTFSLSRCGQKGPSSLFTRMSSMFLSRTKLRLFCNELFNQLPNNTFLSYISVINDKCPYLTSQPEAHQVWIWSNWSVSHSTYFCINISEEIISVFIIFLFCTSSAFEIYLAVFYGNCGLPAVLYANCQEYNIFSLCPSNRRW